jgi:hypothetical protein
MDAVDIENDTQFVGITLRFTDLTISREKRAELERLANEMANLVDSLGYIPPLEEEPSVTFDPRVLLF